MATDTNVTVDAPLREYLWNIAKVVDDAGEGFADSDILVGNALSEIDRREADVCLDARAGPALERLVRVMAAPHIVKLIRAIADRAEDVCSDGCGSHVVETLLGRASEILAAPSTSDAPAEQQTSELCGAVSVLCAALSERLGDAAMDRSGSHVVRALLAMLQGVPASCPLRADLHRTAAGVVAALGTDMAAAVRHTYASPTLQSVLDALSPQPAFVGAVVQRIVDALGDSGGVDDAVRDPVGSHLVEKVLEVAPAAVFGALYLGWFRGRLESFARDRIGNHIIQKLLSSPRCDSAHAALVVTELLPLVKDLVAVPDRAGVVMQAADACARHGVCQAELVRAIRDAVAVGDGEVDFESAANSDTSASDAFAIGLLVTSSPSYVASRTAQALLSMRREVARVFAGSLIAAKQEFLVQLSRTQTGSRVLDAAFASQGLAAAMKQKIVGRLKGRFSDVATSPCGSRVVEKCYAHADLNQKESMAAELLEREQELAADFNGRFVLRACRVKLYKEKREAWRSGAKQSARKREMFSDIITDEAGNTGAKPTSAAGNTAAPAGATEADESASLGDFEEFMSKLGFGKGSRSKLKKKLTAPSGSASSGGATAAAVAKMGATGTTVEVAAPDEAEVSSRQDEIDSLFAGKGKATKSKSKHTGIKQEEEAEAAAAEVQIAQPQQEPEQEKTQPTEEGGSLEKTVAEALTKTLKKHKRKLAKQQTDDQAPAAATTTTTAPKQGAKEGTPNKKRPKFCMM